MRRPVLSDAKGDETAVRGRAETDRPRLHVTDSVSDELESGELDSADAHSVDSGSADEAGIDYAGGNRADAESVDVERVASDRTDRRPPAGRVAGQAASDRR